MRRWLFLNRLSRRTRPHNGFRCVLVVEELEAREVLTPVVFAPYSSPIQTPANVSYTFNSDTGSFYATDTDYYGGPTYQANLTATHGTISVDANYALSEDNVTVTNNGSTNVVLTGSLYGIDDVLENVETFNPAYYYNGDATLGVTVTDLVTSGNPSGSATADIQVLPVASMPAFTVQSSGELPALTASGFAFPPGFVSVAQWPDANGTVTVSFSLDVANADQFTLSVGGTPLTEVAPDLWQVSGTDAAALQTALDSLVVLPPSGFTGRVNVGVSATLVDQVTFADGTSDSASQFLGSATVPLRFYLGGSVTAANATGSEGGTLDLSGLYHVTDPDELSGDTHTLTLSVPNGTLSYDGSAAPSGLSVGDNGNTVALTGTVAEINTFLAAPGSLTYTPDDPQFAGIVPIQLTLTLQPGLPPAPDSGPPPNETQTVVLPPVGGPPPVVAFAELEVDPVADPVYPSAADVATTENAPVATPVTLSGLENLGSSESVRIVLAGVPMGGSFNQGQNLGNGEWAFAPADLTGLTFTPPPDATGAYTFDVTVTVTDFVPGLPASTATESTTFTATVTAPAPVPVPAPAPVPAPTPVPAPAVVVELPGEPTPIEFVVSVPIIVTSSTGGTSSQTDGDGHPVDSILVPGATFVNAYSSGSTVDARPAVTELRPNAEPTGPGSLFAHVEVSLPSYVIGERHPLPPVLPLDQTLPVAGFTESGGDSFALVDRLFRDAAAGSPSATVSLAPEPAPDPHAGAEQVARALLGVAPPNEPGDPPAAVAVGAETPVAAEAEEAGGAWRPWAVAAVAAPLAVWACVSLARDGVLARAVRYVFRGPNRHPLASRGELEKAR